MLCNANGSRAGDGTHTDQRTSSARLYRARSRRAHRGTTAKRTNTTRSESVRPTYTRPTKHSNQKPDVARQQKRTMALDSLVHPQHHAPRCSRSHGLAFVPVGQSDRGAARRLCPCTTQLAATTNPRRTHRITEATTAPDSQRNPKARCQLSHARSPRSTSVPYACSLSLSRFSAPLRWATRESGRSSTSIDAMAVYPFVASSPGHSAPLRPDEHSRLLACAHPSRKRSRPNEPLSQQR